MPVEREGKLDGKTAMMENAVKLALISSGKLVAQRATRKAPMKKGRLKRSITYDNPYAIGKAAWQIDIGTEIKYARIQELGGEIPPHPISARNAQALAFEWPDAPSDLEPGPGGLYYFKSVMHPGATIPAQPYLRPALKESKKEILLLLSKNIIAVLVK